MWWSIAQDVLWLNISVTNSLGMNICNGSEQLVRVHLDNKIRNHLFNFEVLFHDSISSIRNVVHDDIEVHLILVFSISVKTLSHLYAVRVLQHLQNLKFSVFVSFVLENLLDCHCFSSFGNCSLEDDSKGSITNDFLSVVGVWLYKLISCKIKFKLKLIL